VIKRDYTILRTIDEDTCVIEEKSKKRWGVKIASFDELDSGKPVVWDSELLEAEMHAYDLKQKRLREQKLSQLKH